MQVMLVRLMSKGEYLIVPKGTKFTGAGKLGLKRNCLHGCLRKIIFSSFKRFLFFLIKYTEIILKYSENFTFNCVCCELKGWLKNLFFLSIENRTQFIILDYYLLKIAMRIAIVYLLCICIL